MYETIATIAQGTIDIAQGFGVLFVGGTILIVVLPYVALLVIWANTSNIDKNLDKVREILEKSHDERQDRASGITKE